MERLSVRLPDLMFRQLDALALERGVTRTGLVRQLLEAGLRERPEPPSDTPSEDELLTILTEEARAGNVAAVRTLLVREEHNDPRAQALPCLKRWRRRAPMPADSFPMNRERRLATRPATALSIGRLEPYPDKSSRDVRPGARGIPCACANRIACIPSFVAVPPASTPGPGGNRSPLRRRSMDAVLARLVDRVVRHEPRGVRASTLSPNVACRRGGGAS
jgi:hypothetical protein